MSRGNATLKDLAKKLDLSIATVSRALSGRSSMPKATRERVETAAREAGYIPNRAARSLVSGRTGLAALALSERHADSLNEPVCYLITELSSALSHHGIDLLLTTVKPGQSDMEVVDEIIHARKADALILTGVRDGDPRIAPLVQTGFPFVAYGRPQEPDAWTTWVDSDATSAAVQAAQLLVDLGHRRFVLIRSPEDTTFRDRWTMSVKHTLTLGGVPPAQVTTLTIKQRDRATLLPEIKDALERVEPTAILALDDDLALASIDAATGLGWHVPEQLSVIGFGASRAGTLLPPGLTTFDPDVRQCAKCLAQVLDALLGGGDPRAHSLRHSIRPKLVSRGSHCPVRNAPVEDLSEIRKRHMENA
ncbi:MAG: LacI family DNA-binding transcriptional regulator [Pseudomonadota bacterium]